MSEQFLTMFLFFTLGAVQALTVYVLNGVRGHLHDLRNGITNLTNRVALLEGRLGRQR